MREFFGIYLDELFGYKRIYVLSDSDRFVFGFAKGRDTTPAEFARIEPALKDLVLAVRKPEAASRQYDVVTTRIDLGGGCRAAPGRGRRAQNWGITGNGGRLDDHPRPTARNGRWPRLLSSCSRSRISIVDLSISSGRTSGLAISNGSTAPRPARIHRALEGEGVSRSQMDRRLPGRARIYRDREGEQRSGRRHACLAQGFAGLAIRTKDGRRTGNRARAAGGARARALAMGEKAGTAAIGKRGRSTTSRPNGHTYGIAQSGRLERVVSTADRKGQVAVVDARIP